VDIPSYAYAIPTMLTRQQIIASLLSVGRVTPCAPSGFLPTRRPDLGINDVVFEGAEFVCSATVRRAGTARPTIPTRVFKAA